MVEKRSGGGKLAFALLTVLSVCLLAGCGAGKKIDLFDYITVSFSGEDGSGYATVYDEYDYEDDEKLFPEGDSDADEWNMMGTMILLEDAFEIEVDPKSGLSNGDTVTVTVTADNDAIKKTGYKFVTGSKKYTVEGLD